VFLELSVRQLLVQQDPKDVNIFYQGKISKDENLFWPKNTALFPGTNN